MAFSPEMRSKRIKSLCFRTVAYLGEAVVEAACSCRVESVPLKKYIFSALSKF